MQAPPGTFIQPPAFRKEVLGTSPASAGRAAQGRAHWPVVSVPRFSAPPRAGQEASAALRNNFGIFSMPVVTHTRAQTRAGPPGIPGPGGAPGGETAARARPGDPTDRYRPGELFSRSASHPMPELLLLEPRLAQPSAKAAGVISSSCSTADTELDSSRASLSSTGCPSAAAPAQWRAGSAVAAGDAPATRTATISLHENLQQLAVGSRQAPTEGSKNHHLGQCKPCAFVFKGGCTNGVSCKFCHLCPPEEKKMRKKTWKEQKRASKVCVVGPGDRAFAAGGGGILVAAEPL